MDWLKPIQERLDILASTRGIPSDEDTTVVDMLEADVRKLVAAVRLAEAELGGLATDALYGKSVPGQYGALGMLNVLQTRAETAVARLRSGEVK